MFQALQKFISVSIMFCNHAKKLGKHLSRWILGRSSGKITFLLKL